MEKKPRKFDERLKKRIWKDRRWKIEQQRQYHIISGESYFGMGMGVGTSNMALWVVFFG